MSSWRGCLPYFLNQFNQQAILQLSSKWKNQIHLLFDSWMKSDISDLFVIIPFLSDFPTKLSIKHFILPIGSGFEFLDHLDLIFF